MTATPIPRTLYMSLSGVRDMSVIETAPLARLPVETLVRRFSLGVIKEAIERELERGGQVFFVHNRVQSLVSMTRLLQELAPDARIVMAHGRVDEQAQRRLRVLQELTELGSGFKLALRDLEIRGSGNLLGAEQHGHIAAVGFDLYSKLLNEAVRELKGDPTAAPVDPVISVTVEG